jgi:hypothetical protein
MIGGTKGSTSVADVAGTRYGYAEISSFGSTCLHNTLLRDGKFPKAVISSYKYRDFSCVAWGTY